MKQKKPQVPSSDGQLSVYSTYDGARLDGGGLLSTFRPAVLLRPLQEVPHLFPRLFALHQLKEEESKITHPILQGHYWPQI